MPLFVNIAACALAIAQICAALPSSATYVMHEQRSALADGGLQTIQKRSKLPNGHILPMRIGLTQSGLEEGHDWLMDVAHPESVNYGKYVVSDWSDNGGCIGRLG